MSAVCEHGVWERANVFGVGCRYPMFDAALQWNFRNRKKKKKTRRRKDMRGAKEEDDENEDGEKTKKKKTVRSTQPNNMYDKRG